ncbi:unnamed protein product [Brassicogethes aeneus]|uniref:RING-type E3 ubiquitin transferase BRCA1 n=1 Tax=Brassicogethes aeneus TaxID=1431903 RepID=A0A9P0FII3_BRAAE|nr:unnamed protein product [Brassicogethes aeneus]
MSDFDRLKYKINKLATCIKCCNCNQIVPNSIDLQCKHFCCEKCYKSIKNKCPKCKEHVEGVTYDENVTAIGNVLKKLYDSINTNYNVNFETLIKDDEILILNPVNKKITNQNTNEPVHDIIKPLNDNKTVKNKRKNSLNASNKTNKSATKTRKTKDKSFTEVTVEKNKRTSKKHKENVVTATKNYKTDVVQWLNSNKNDFDRITQTQQRIVDDIALEGTTPSISQLNNPKITRRTTRKTNNKKTRCKSLEVQIKKPRNNMEQRHSISSELLGKENYNIDDINTEEIKKIVKETEVKVIENLLEDEYLDRLESEMLNINKDQKNEDESMTSSGWDRIKDISKKISKKGKKQLNVTLEPVNTSQVHDFKGKTAFVKLLDISKDPNINLSGASLKKQNSEHHMEILNVVDNKNDDLEILNDKSNNSVKENDIHIILETYSSDGKKDKENIIEVSQGTTTKDLNSNKNNLDSSILEKLQLKLKNTISLLVEKSFNKNVVLKNLEECEEHVNMLKNTNPEKTYLEKCVQVTQSKENKTIQTFFEQNNISVQTENADLINKSPQTKTQKNPSQISQNIIRSLSSDPIDNLIINSQGLVEGFISPKQNNNQEHSDEIIGNKKSNKRPMVIDSDESEDYAPKKPCFNRFTKSNLSIKFESQVGDSPKNSDDKMNLSENIDYEDYLAKVMKKYDDGSMSSEIINPVKIPTQNKANLENLSLSFEKNENSAKSKKSQRSRETSQPGTPSSIKFDDENYFDECCITNIDKEIENYKHHKHSATELSDIISETEDIQPLKKLKRADVKKNKAASIEQNRDITDFENEDIEIEEDELVEIERKAKENKKINVLQEVILQNPNNEDRNTPGSDIFENEDNLDIIEATPPRKEIRNESQNLSQIPQFSTLEMAAFDVALPPPAEFCDVAPDDLEIKNTPTTSTNLNDSLFVRSPETVKSLDISRTSTPHSRCKKPELNFSPIFSQNRKVLTQTPKSSMLSCIPGQKSLFSYLKKTPSTQQSTPEKVVNTSFREKPLVTSTRIDKDQMIGISTLAHRKIIAYTTTYTENVTHLIANVDKNNYVEEHTMKFILAVASGAWVLNVGWIKECLEKNRVVPEAPYEVLDGSGIAGPKISRLTRKSNPLFRGFKFCCRPPFQSAVKDDVETVLRLLDGKIVNDISTMGIKDGLHGIIVSEIVGTQDFDIYERMLEKYKCVTVDLEWISKSVAQYRLTSVRPYLLCSEDLICDLGYPQPLLDFVPLTGTEDD